MFQCVLWKSAKPFAATGIWGALKCSLSDWESEWEPSRSLSAGLRPQRRSVCVAKLPSLLLPLLLYNLPPSSPPLPPLPHSSSCSKNSWQQTVTTETKVMNSWKSHSASPSASRLSIRASRAAWSFTCCGGHTGTIIYNTHVIIIAFTICSLSGRKG